MLLKTSSRAAVTATVVAFTAAAAVVVTTAPTEAHKTGYKHSHAKHKSSRKSKRKYSRSSRYDRDPAVFASEVDLSRPGGTQKFFEMLNEENR